MLQQQKHRQSKKNQQQPMKLHFFPSLFLIFFPFFLLLSIIFKHLLFPPNIKPTSSPLPPSISILPILFNIIINRGSLHHITALLRRLHFRHGPILTAHLLPFTPPTIFISSSSIAHTAFFHHSNSFSNRPLQVEPNIFLTVKSHDISSSNHNYLWSLLRRNLTSEILHSSRLSNFATTRTWSVQALLENFHSHAGHHHFVPKKSFLHALLSIHVYMCFGEKLGESEIHEMEQLQAFLLSIFSSFNVFAFLPLVTKLLFSKKWEGIVYARRRQAEIFLPLIRARREKRLNMKERRDFDYCYVDSLLDLRVDVEGERRLNDEEMVNLCHEFLSGSVTTATALEWTMAELVKHQSVQTKILAEIKVLFGSTP